MAKEPVASREVRAQLARLRQAVGIRLRQVGQERVAKRVKWVWSVFKVGSPQHGISVFLILVSQLKSTTEEIPCSSLRWGSRKNPGL